MISIAWVEIIVEDMIMINVMNSVRIVILVKIRFKISLELTSSKHFLGHKTVGELQGRITGFRYCNNLTSLLTCKKCLMF